MIDIENLHAKNRKEFHAALALQRAIRRFLKRIREWKCGSPQPRPAAAASAAAVFSLMMWGVPSSAAGCMMRPLRARCAAKFS